MRAIVVASGPSALNFQPPHGALVIAVNGAIDRLSRADYFFTLDPSLVNLERMSRVRPGVEYCAAVPPDIELLDHVQRYYRATSTGPEPKETGSPTWWLWRWSCARGFARAHNVINTGNSAWGALQLAHKLGAERVALIGVDASQQPRIEGGEPNNLSHLPLLFESALEVPDFEFVNCGAMESAVPAMSIEEGMQWLMQ